MPARSREMLFRAALVAIIVAAGAVRAFSLPPFPSDHDEAFQGMVIRSPTDRFWRELEADAVHPPLDYLVDRGILAISPAAVRHRVPVVIWGALTVGILGLLLRDRCGRAAALLSAALLAAAPYHVAETRRLRPYALGTLLVCLSLHFLGRLIDRPTRARAACFFASAAACLATLYVAGLILAIACAGMLAEGLLSGDDERREDAKRAARLAAIAGAFALAAISPWLPTILGAARRPPVAAPPAESAARWSRVVSYFAFSPNAGYAFPPRPLFLAGAAVAAALLGLGLAFSLSRERTRFLLVWGPGALAATEILKRYHPHYDSFRYFLPAGIAVTGMWGVAFAGLARERKTRLFAAVLLAVVFALDAVSLARYYRFGIWDFSSGRTKTTSSGLTKPSFSRAFFSSS